MRLIANWVARTFFVICFLSAGCMSALQPAIHTPIVWKAPQQLPALNGIIRASCSDKRVTDGMIREQWTISGSRAAKLTDISVFHKYDQALLRMPGIQRITTDRVCSNESNSSNVPFCIRLLLNDGLLEQTELAAALRRLKDGDPILKDTELQFCIAHNGMRGPRCSPGDAQCLPDSFMAELPRSYHKSQWHRTEDRRKNPPHCVNNREGIIFEHLSIEWLPYCHVESNTELCSYDGECVISREKCLHWSDKSIWTGGTTLIALAFEKQMFCGCVNHACQRFSQ